MSVYTLSAQQEFLIRQIVEEQQNVIVSAKAGCAKSSSCKEAADRYTRRYGGRALIFTYNTKLAHEFRQQLMESKLQNRIHCYTYHGVALKFFLDRENRTTFQDSLIYDALQQTQVKPDVDLQDIGIVFIDEAQDLTDSLAKLVQLILREIYRASGKKPLLCLVGDPFQQIYTFRHTNLTYMMKPEVHFGEMVANNGKFLTAELNISFRLTHNVTDWINEFMHPKYLQFALSKEKWQDIGSFLLNWWGTGIHAHPNNLRGEEVSYLKADFNFESVCKQIFPIYQTKKNEDVLLITYSGKSAKSPIWKLINGLNKLHKKENCPEVSWAYCFSEDEQEEERHENSQLGDLYNGKRIVSTIHKVKGLEKPVVIVFGLDAFFEKIADIFELFKIFYVALTRAREKLVIIQCDKNPFLSIRKALELYSKTPIPFPLNESAEKRKRKLTPQLKMHKIGDPYQLVNRLALRYNRGLRLSDVFDFVPFDIWLEREAYIYTKEEITGYDDMPELDLSPEMYIVQGKDPLTVEDVRPLYSLALQIAIRMYFEKSCILPSYAQIFGQKKQLGNEEQDKELNKFFNQIRTQKIQEIEPVTNIIWTNWSSLVMASNAYRTLHTGIYSHWKQIQNYKNFVPDFYLSHMLCNSIVLIEQVCESQGIDIQHHIPDFHYFLTLPLCLLNQKIDLVNHVFCRFRNLHLHLNLRGDTCSESQMSLAYATMAMETILNTHIQEEKRETLLYIISPQRKVIHKLNKNPQDPKTAEDFILYALVRKLVLDPSLIEIAPKRKQKEFHSSKRKRKFVALVDPEQPRLEKFFRFCNSQKHI